MCRFNSPITVQEHPTMNISHAPRNFMSVNGVTYNLLETMNRGYWLFENDLVSVNNWMYVLQGIERVRWERNLDWEIAMPPLNHQVNAPYMRIDLWMARNGVRAGFDQQPVDLTAEDEEELEGGISDEVMNAAMDLLLLDGIDLETFGDGDQEWEHDDMIGNVDEFEDQQEDEPSF